MGIGRRNFIKLSSLALAGLAVDPLQAVVVNNNAYVNKKLGVLFYKPDQWGYIQVQDFGQLKEKQILANGWEHSKDEVYESMTDPICVITKYYEDLPEYEGIFSPTITMNIEHKSELEEYANADFELIRNLSEMGVTSLLKDFEVVKRHEPYLISGCKFYEYDATYQFEHVELDGSIKIELNVLKAEHNDYYYSFNLHQSAEVDQTAKKEFDAFKKSLRLI